MSHGGTEKARRKNVSHVLTEKALRKNVSDGDTEKARRKNYKNLRELRASVRKKSYLTQNLPAKKIHRELRASVRKKLIVNSVPLCEKIKFSMPQKIFFTK